MRDLVDSTADSNNGKREARRPQLDGGWQTPAPSADHGVPAGFGAHFPVNPPWQTRRAGWRLFVQSSSRSS
jgi:hypothetical protein